MCIFYKPQYYTICSIAVHVVLVRTFDFSLLVAGCNDWLTGLGGSDADVMTSSGLLSTVYIDDECAADDVTDL